MNMKMLGRSSRYESEKLGQIASSLIPKICLISFFIGILIFTVTHEPNQPITNILSSDSDSDSGEGFVPSNPISINVSDLDTFSGTGPDEPEPEIDDRVCKSEGPIDCRDPDLFHMLMRAAIDKFKNVHFYRFGKPVKGDDDMSCHMAWRYRPKEGNSASFNKDYRSFTVLRSENCTLSVVGIGEYHSGGNARKRKVKGGKKNNSAQDVFDKIPAKEIGDTDQLPALESFSGGKYLIYSGGGDRCKSMHQYLWSFACMLGEARYLNRTLVMDLSLCLSGIYSSPPVDEEGKDFRFYFDFDHLKDSAPVLDKAHFWSYWNNWQEKGGLALHLVEDFRVSPTKLAEVKDSLVMRKFGSVEPDNYWYQVCEGESGRVIERPWHMIRKSGRLLEVASGISSRMNMEFDAIRVDRGTKVEHIISTLKGKIENGRDLYVATDERDVSIFEPLKEKHKIHFLDEYKDLWEGNSNWFDETTKLNNGNSVEFDGYMRKSVDAEVFLMGKKQIEIFNDASRESKDGISHA